MCSSLYTRTYTPFISYRNLFGNFINILVRGSYKCSWKSDVYETLAPAIFDYEDFISESWHTAKKIREEYSVNKSTSALFS